MKRLFVVVVTLTLLLAGAQAEAQFDNVGSLNFPTSGSAEAQQHFLRGVATLHSFGWKQAIGEFQAAQRLEPDFAMAYWGETLCYNHPLFATAPDNDNPRAVLRRLGATREERLAKAPDQTCLVVSHRRAALQRADRIVLLKEGRVEAMGTLEELLDASEEMRGIWRGDSAGAPHT